MPYNIIYIIIIYIHTYHPFIDGIFMDFPWNKPTSGDSPWSFPASKAPNQRLTSMPQGPTVDLPQGKNRWKAGKCPTEMELQMGKLSINDLLVRGFNLPLWKMMEWVTVGVKWHSQLFLESHKSHVPNHQAVYKWSINDGFFIATFDLPEANWCWEISREPNVFFCKNHAKKWFSVPYYRPALQCNTYWVITKRYSITIWLLMRD